jgi:hypothetical protein
MFYRDFHLAEAIVKIRLQETARRCEARRLLRQAGIDQRGWWTRQRCWLSCHLGRLLVALGQRLQQYGQPSATLLNGQISRGALSGNEG